MQFKKNNHKHIWILTGTGDGLPLVKALLQEGFKVSVSVVTENAALPYRDLPIEAVFTGPLKSSKTIRIFLDKANSSENRFDWVIDATHPFAKIISANLKLACNQIKQPLLRFERFVNTSPAAYLIQEIDDIPIQYLIEKNILFAIGSRELASAVNNASKLGANIFARVLPYPESIRLALGSNIPSENLAIIKPMQFKKSGLIENALCQKWNINTLICRESGGITQAVWQEVCEHRKINLFMIKRPEILPDLTCVRSLDELLQKISS